MQRSSNLVSYTRQAQPSLHSCLLPSCQQWPEQQPEQPPVVTEKVMQPKDNIEETPQATVSTTTEQPVVAQAEKPQPAKKRRKVHKPIFEEPVPQEAEPAQVEPERENEYLPQQPDLYLMAIADAQDIRSRGERLYQEVAQLMKNH